MNRALRAGLPTAWIERGAGTRRAVFVHCSLASHRAWSAVMDRLDDALAMTAFDMPGHGRSDDWAGEGDLLVRSAEVAETFCEGPVDLVGHSFGGVASLRLAVERPDLIRTLSLIEPVFFAAARGTPEHAAYRAGFEPVQRAMARGDKVAATRLFTDAWGGGTPWDELPETQRAERVRRIPLIAASQPGLEEDSGDILGDGRLEAVAAPVVLVAGGRSDPVIGRIQAALAERLPDARMVTVPDAGHMVPLSHPDAIAGEIRAQLSRREG